MRKIYIPLIGACVGAAAACPLIAKHLDTKASDAPIVCQEITAPVIMALEGQKLDDLQLPDGFTFEDQSLDVGKAGTRTVDLHYGDSILKAQLIVSPGYYIPQTVYRAFNPEGYHVFTTDRTEFDQLLSLGWIEESAGFIGSEDGDEVYRLYDPTSGDHILTMAAKEKELLVAAGWNDEGILTHSDPARRYPVYRLFNPNSGEHFYAARESEVHLLEDSGWINEGISFYSFQAA